MPLRALCPLAVVFYTMIGCGEQYCQRGAKTGTQCYTINEVEWQETQVRAEPPIERTIEPSPGCVLVTKNGYVVSPPSGGIPPPRSGLYLMSGACVTRRQTVHGAIR